VCIDSLQKAMTNVEVLAADMAVLARGPTHVPDRTKWRHATESKSVKHRWSRTTTRGRESVTGHGVRYVLMISTAAGVVLAGR